MAFAGDSINDIKRGDLAVGFGLFMKTVEGGNNVSIVLNHDQQIST